MPPLNEQEETQRLDDDDDQSTVPLDETLEIETEKVMEDSILYGETQALDDDDGSDLNKIDDSIKTQVLGDDDHEIDDEEIEMTEVANDGARVLTDGVDSDASTDEGSRKGDDASSALVLSGGSSKSNNGSVRSIAAVRAASLRFSGLAAAQSITAKAVVFDLKSPFSNGSVRSIAAVRTASLRSSGLAAAQSITSKAVVFDLKSPFSNGEKCNNQDNGVHGQTGTSRMVTPLTWSNSTADLTLLDTKAGEIDSDRETDNSKKCTQDYHRHESKSSPNNPVVKKLLYELTSAEEETTSKPNSTTVQVDSPGFLVPDNSAGLSYVGTQEHGDLSQDNAFDVVNKFLVVNDLGLSQEADIGKSTDMVKSHPVPSAKVAQVLAKKTDHRSPVGKTGTFGFEWIDGLEDEGGGEFFSKRKDSFFERKDDARKSRSQPPKSRQDSFGFARKAVIGDEGGKPKNHEKMTSLTRSDSRLVQNNSSINEKVHVAETRTKKNLVKDLEQSSSKYLNQQLEVADVDRGQESVCEIGRDTQMVAEAMEALVHGTPIKNETNGAHPAAGKLTKNLSEGRTKRAIASKRAFSRKTTFYTANLNDVSTRSKQRKMLPTNSKQGTPISSGSNSRGKKSLECTSEKTISKRGKKKLEQNLNAKSSVNENECSVSFKGEKALGHVNRNFTNGSHKCSDSLSLNVQLSVSKELIQGEFRVNSTPIAHRTRHSRAVTPSKKAEDVATDCGKDRNVTINVRTRGTIAREDQLFADTGGSRKTKRKYSGIGSVQNFAVERDFMSHTEAQDIEDLHEEVVKAGSPVKSALTHPKRRRTSLPTPDSSNINDSLKIPSLFNDSIQPRTRQKKIAATVENVSEILDAAKRKRRSVSTYIVSEIDGLNSDGGKATFISGVRTRSSLKSSSFKSNVENVSINCLSRTVTHTAGSTEVANPCSTPPFKQGADIDCQVEVAEENAKPEESPKEKLKPSSLTCATASKDADAMSPVCVAQDHPRTPGTKGRSRSLIARELIRLETSKSSPTFTLNLRRRKDMAKVCVLFSHHLEDDIVKQQKKILGRLGVPLASSMSEATHFVTDNFVRTRNMLEAMARGKPVVTHMWLESCGHASCFIDEKNYILRDAKKEREIRFSMSVSLACACQNPLLQGKRVYITPNIKPGMEVISSLVKAAHGQPMERVGRSAMKDYKIPDDLLVLSCEEDYSICIPLLEKGAEIFGSELLLNGIVIQKLEYERRRLFLDHVKRTRSTIWLRREDGSQFLPVTRCT